MSSIAPQTCRLIRGVLAVHAQFKAAKDESKRKLEASRTKFAEMDADVQERFQAMESVSFAPLY